MTDRSGGCHPEVGQFGVSFDRYLGRRAMKEMDRREFIKQVAIGGAILGLGNALLQKPLEALAGGKYDIGQCKSVRIKCISEVGWYDTKNFIRQIRRGGGPGTSQWIIPWDPNNSAGCSSLIDLETLDGRHHKFLMDAGWNHDHMETCFKREGIDKMLANKEIEFLFISHEHVDHLWGLETVLKHNPEIKIIIPSTFYPEGMHLIRGAEFIIPGARNQIPHKGKLVQLKPGHINKLYNGCAGVAFDLNTFFRVRGEQSLYFNVKDKGIVCVTGCCHQKILTFADFCQEKILGGENMYGIYGGLHIAPFGPLRPNQEELVIGMAKYDFKRIAANHCTGLPAVQKMIELGYPVVRGTGRLGSKSDLYVGNGDEVTFG
jgi:7,8-dihydropterin-6-yl-methyl-4-(beta-D-ribofuranosyl)aminobenzene 5'-phosphate synthase